MALLYTTLVMINEATAFGLDQEREHLYTGFLKEATALLIESFTGDVTERQLAKLIKSLWKLKHNFRLYQVEEAKNLITYLSSQRKDQSIELKSPLATYTVFLSKAAALLTEAFGAENDPSLCLGLASILLSMKQSFEKHFDKAGLTTETLYLAIGMAEVNHKSAALKKVVASFSTQYKAQKIITDKITTFIKPSILPALHLYQVNSHTDSATQYRQGFYLIGEKRLPENYQYLFESSE